PEYPQVLLCLVCAGLTLSSRFQKLFGKRNYFDMIYRTAFLLSLLTTGLIAQSGDRSDIDLSSPPPEWEIPEAPVLSPEEALESFTLQPGFRIELVASEPLIADPVAIDIDADGRI